MEPSCDAAALLRSLIVVPSVSGEEGRIADRLQVELGRCGAEPKRVGDSLWFERSGPQPGPSLLLAAHIDTVAPGEGWTVDPYGAIEKKGRIYGRGAVDDKASVAVFTACGLALRPAAGRLVVALTSGEETGKSGLLDLLEPIGPVDAAVIGEPTALEICVRQRGLLVLTAVAAGKAGHVGRPEGTVNAIEVAADDIRALAEIDLGPADPYLGAPRAAVTGVRGGTAHNVIPDRCELTIDVRTVPGLTQADYLERIRGALCSEVHPHSDRYRPCCTDEDEPIVKSARAANPRGRLIGSPTASDWAFLHVPAVKMGPGDPALSHRPDESIAIDEVTRAVDVFIRLAEQYLGG